jgi:hypothetical protein
LIPVRRKPYTEIGIRRMPCARCGAKASFQWQICADGRQFRPLCAPCDVELNEMVMRWVWGDTREDDLRRYREEKLAA